jgi:hypothetical protein
MNVCTRCGAQTLPHTGCCLDCGLDAETQERVLARRLEVTLVETTQREALGDLLRACAPEQADRIERLLSLGHFEIAVEARPLEIAALEGACLALGARVLVSDRFSAGVTPSLMWDWTGWIRSKMAVAVAVGGLGWQIGVPLATCGGAVMFAVLVRRAAHLVEPQLTIASANLQSSFRPIDPALFANLKSVREHLTDPVVIGLLRDCAAAFAELAWLLKGDGAGVGNRLLRRVDSRLRHLVERACGLARAADGAARSHVLERTSSTDGLDALSLLGTIRDRLVGLRPAIADSRTDARERDAVARALDAIADVDAVLDRTLP